eukprot:14314705-Alexandrium_andersonii.AAC.1
MLCPHGGSPVPLASRPTASASKSLSAALVWSARLAIVVPSSRSLSVGCGILFRGTHEVTSYGRPAPAGTAPSRFHPPDGQETHGIGGSIDGC